MSQAAPLGAIATLEDLASRRRECARMIRGIAGFYGVDPAKWLADNEAAAETRPRVNGTKHVARGTKGAPLATKRGKREARPTTAPTETQERILTALKEANEPVSPGELAGALKMDVGNLRYHLKGLITSKQILAAGTTGDRRLSLP